MITFNNDNKLKEELGAKLKHRQELDALAESARSAAESAHYTWLRDQLINLLKTI